MLDSKQYAVVTGGGSGIGFELAKLLAGSGYQVLIVGRNESKLQLARDRLPGLQVLKADLRIREDIARIRNTVEAGFGRVDVLVNNAGVGHFEDDEIDLEKITDHIATNFIIPLELTAEMLSLLRKSLAPKVVFLGSAMAYSNAWRWASYSASKSALHVYLRAIRRNLKLKDLRFIEVLPSFVATDFTQDLKTAKLSPEDVAKAVLSAIVGHGDEVRVGKASLVYWMSRIAPRFIEKLLDRMIRK
ncbi:MAG: SDR family NAD(P)-dependent oxidoreductase [Nitrospirae bacterium]|nr:SDR family NAD(P)-dependent oxidoreductase [Nitrospirota bacterium]MBI3351342.1 SDR family NAD(P)-dependent oxidoreductase [Nitrospirota bacterium]